MSFLLVNVLKREVVFAKDSPVIKITFAVDTGASSEQQKRKNQPGGGRKRSITKSGDDKLVKRLKLGESVSRNERQMKLLDSLNLVTCVLSDNDNDDDDNNNKKIVIISIYQISG